MIDPSEVWSRRTRFPAARCAMRPAPARWQRCSPAASPLPRLRRGPTNATAISGSYNVGTGAAVETSVPLLGPPSAPSAPRPIIGWSVTAVVRNRLASGFVVATVICFPNS